MKGHGIMDIDMERIMVLLQRKYGSIREVDRLTKELEEALGRNDEISADMILEMRGEEMEKADRCMEEIWQMGEENRENNERLQYLIASDLEHVVGKTKEEKMIFEIRRKTQKTIDGLRSIDQRLNQKITGKKSFYYESIIV